MSRALIGHTGFVGSSLKATGEFTHFYNSWNFREMAGQRFDEVVCAGVSAVKWLANKEPERDWQAIEALLAVLEQVKADRFTLISTIDVYPDPSTSADEATVLPANDGHPYGVHRRAIERFVNERFSDTLIARLPALFGPGLKKNAIFDLLTGNQTDKINPRSVFQWYPVERLAADLAVSRQAGLELVNLFPEPLETERILQDLFPDAVAGLAVDPAPHYRLRTRHARTFGGPDGYIMTAGSVLARLDHFVRMAKAAPLETLGS